VEARLSCSSGPPEPSTCRATPCAPQLAALALIATMHPNVNTTVRMLELVTIPHISVDTRFVALRSMTALKFSHFTV
jgi:hypothetical protein